jgi:hypothetical protein
VDYTLHHPEKSWPPINPQGWVTERRYNQRDLAESMANFMEKRYKSLAWLRGLVNPEWQSTVTAPFGRFSAGDIFASWAAHDLLHMRQLVELHWAWLVRMTDPYKVDYAGEW